MAKGDADSVVISPLRASGLLTAASLEKARAHVTQNGGLLSDALLRLNLLNEHDFLQVFSDLYAVPFMKGSALKTMKLDRQLLDRVGVRSAERLRMCPLRWDPSVGELHVVAAVPLATALDTELRQVVGARTVSVYVATPGVVAAVIRRAFYGQENAFNEVTRNGAGPQFPSEAAVPPPVMEEEPTSVPFHTDTPPPQVEGKTVVVSLNDVNAVEALKKENARYRIAQEFMKRVTLERSMDVLMQRILGVMFELLPADGAAVWLADGRYASKMKEAGKTLEVPRTIIDQTMTSANGVLTHDALLDDRFDRSKSVVVRGVRSVMSVPLRTQNGTLGVLYVESRSMSAAFTADDLPMLDSIGAQAATLIDNANLLAKVREEVANRVTLSRFLSAAAVEEVLSGRMSLNVGGQAAEVTLLFADLRGFTTLSAHMRPEEVVAFLNQFFGEAVEAVEKHGGIIDKFIGDCVMAMWGAPEPRHDDARNAIKAALEMVERCSKIVVGEQKLEIGVGVHSGVAVVGAIGSKQRSDYTAIGATVNLAARLCGVARANEVLVTSDALMRAGPGVVTEANEPVVFKGLDVPAVPYTVKSVAQPLLLSLPASSAPTRPIPVVPAAPVLKPRR